MPRSTAEHYTTRSIALPKQPEVAMTHSGITADVLGAGLDRIPQNKHGAILAEFPHLALKNGLKECLCNIARRKPESSFLVRTETRTCGLSPISGAQEGAEINPSSRFGS